MQVPLCCEFWERSVLGTGGGQRRGMMVACYSALHPVFILFFSSLPVHMTLRLPGGAS